MSLKLSVEPRHSLSLPAQILLLRVQLGLQLSDLRARLATL